MQDTSRNLWDDSWRRITSLHEQQTIRWSDEQLSVWAQNAMHRNVEGPLVVDVTPYAANRLILQVQKQFEWLAPIP